MILEYQQNSNSSSDCNRSIQTNLAKSKFDSGIFNNATLARYAITAFQGGGL